MSYNDIIDEIIHDWLDEKFDYSHNVAEEPLSIRDEFRQCMVS